MKIEPKIELRKELKYVAIESRLKREDIPEQLPPLIPEIFNWLEKENIKPSGPPFFSYLNMNDSRMLIKVGVQVDSTIPKNDRIKYDSFPAGKYAVVIYTGDYKNLYEVHSEFDKWAKENGIKLKGDRIELYPTDPQMERNPDKWKTIVMNQIYDP